MILKINKSIIFSLLLFLIINIFLFDISFAQAAAENAPDITSNLTESAFQKKGIVPGECKGQAVECDLWVLLELVSNIFKLILGLLGTLGLFFFIYGGFVFLLSRGNQQMVQKGKDILTGAVIGITIVMASWIITNIVIILLTTGNFDDTGKIFNLDWSSPFTKK